MKTIDASNFEGDPFQIKTKHSRNPDGSDYTIEFIDAIYEIKLMQMQGDITRKAGKWENIEQQDFDKWRDLIKKIIKVNGNIQVIDDKKLDEDINKLSPVHILGILMGLISHLAQKSRIVYDGLDEEAKKEAEKLEDDIKKKTIENI